MTGSPVRGFESHLLRCCDGRSDSGRSYARTVVRTKTREAVETARRQRLVELDIDLVMIVGKVSNTFCTAYLGQVFSLSGRHPKYPALASLQGGGPPFHPNCSKSTRAFVEELATEAQQEEAQPDGDVQKLIGLPPTQAQRAYKDLQLRPQSQQRNSRSAQSIGDSRYRTGTPDSLIRPRIPQGGTPDSPGNYRIFSGYKDAHTWGLENSRQWASSVDRPTKHNFAAYQESDHRIINAICAGQTAYYDGTANRPITAADLAEWMPRIEAMKSALGQATINQPVTVFRGCMEADTVFGGRPVSSDIVGQVIPANMFQSTSLTRDTADGFASKNRNNRPIILHIRLPNGTRGAYIDALTGGDGVEQEVILPPGVKYRVVEVGTTKVFQGHPGEFIAKLVTVEVINDEKH